MHQTSFERVSDLTRLGGEGDSQGIVQEIEIWTYEQIYTIQNPSWKMRNTKFPGILKYKQIR